MLRADSVEEVSSCGVDDLPIRSWSWPGPTLMMEHREVEQAALSYEFSLEKHAPPDHLLCSIERYVELDQGAE